MGLPGLILGCKFVFILSLIISKRLRASDPFILLRNFFKKQGPPKQSTLDFSFHSLMVCVLKYICVVSFCFLGKILSRI